MQGQAIGLKRRIGVVVAATVMATTMVATPAEAAVPDFFKTCNRKDTPKSERRCCENRSNSNAQENRCIDYVRSH